MTSSEERHAGGATGRHSPRGHFPPPQPLLSSLHSLRCRGLRGLALASLRSSSLLRRVGEDKREELVVLVSLLLLSGVVGAVEAASAGEAALLEAEGVDAVAGTLLLFEIGAAGALRAWAALGELHGGRGSSGAADAQLASRLQHERLGGRKEGEDDQKSGAERPHASPWSKRDLVEVPTEIIVAPGFKDTSVVCMCIGRREGLVFTEATLVTVQ